jgi:hypothetical protein
LILAMRSRVIQHDRSFLALLFGWHIHAAGTRQIKNIFVDFKKFYDMIASKFLLMIAWIGFYERDTSKCSYAKDRHS